MKIFAVIFILTLAFLITYSATEARNNPCPAGTAKAFVAMNKQPFLIGRLPNKFTPEPAFFGRRYNCKNQEIMAKRIDDGVYDILIPGVTARVYVATAINQEGTSASAYYLGNSVYRVVLRGPGPPLRDVAFSLVVF